ncbi:hypothetical protein WBJ53_01515 [Spirosoma sp. SC4-14]|uniref:toxin-antitoxin system YwqK family antitoxin n=1 Tax=Spirosoma sp. SC4-14 TaxID=3128900 RepID=UPI0030CA8237
MSMLYFKYFLVVVIFIESGTLFAQGKPSQPSSLTTASKPVLAPSGAPESPFASVPSSMTTLGLPSMSSLKGQKDTYISEVQDLGLKIKQLKKAKSEKKAKKKTAKNEYEGLAMVKAYTKIGSGDRTIIEEFHILRDNDAAKPLPYIRDIYRYYQRSGRVTSSIIRDEGSGLLLHGPYKRYQNGNLIEEGYYYAGMKDGRWEKYDSHFILLDKTRWQKGVPAESRLTFYDSTHRKIKEIVPIEYGKIKGTYMAFYENGLLAEEGKYDNGIKIGRWTEFYPISPSGRRMRKKLMQYGRDQWDTEFEPFVITEWDEKGKVTYERSKDKKVVDEEEAEN